MHSFSAAPSSAAPNGIRLPHAPSDSFWNRSERSGEPGVTRVASHVPAFTPMS
jgi:hypothetical protein